MLRKTQRCIRKTFKDVINITMLESINSWNIDSYGGSGIGYVNKNLALSIVEGVNQEVFGVELNPTIEDKIAHVCIGLIKGHCFMDANKRTGISVFMLLCEEFEINIDDLDCIELAMNIATDKIDKDKLVKILKNR